ncbi:hypothetical protein [Bradyrhizobium sp. SZCCHNS3002]|uniref:hypothetical protein n=1 Tax=Bradyrhizobium sp. SZCCHNS3002 TaxID=3057310 RepID=UPI0028F0345C|nr:hypothetical protein [Bradyrhizobium sp. SZCCHNS3002]
MIQPTKDELRQWLREAREQARVEKKLRNRAEYELGIAKRKLGGLVLEGKIAVPAELLGQIVIRMSEAEEIDATKTGKLLSQD